MKINSFLSFSTQDGPGIRSVIFLQGCNLKCIYCHNPETQSCLEKGEGLVTDTSSFLFKIRKYKSYYGLTGGVTISGGEPLMQIDELLKFCKELKEDGIHVCIETNGYFKDKGKTKELLKYCDIVYCDLKFNSNEDYKKYVGVAYLDNVVDFLLLCKEMNKEVIVRSVIVPNINDNELYIKGLKDVLDKNCIDYPIKLLGFTNICIEKYHSIGKKFELENCENLGKERLNQLQDYLDSLYI